MITLFPRRLWPKHEDKDYLDGGIGRNPEKAALRAKAERKARLKGIKKVPIKVDPKGEKFSMETASEEANKRETRMRNLVMMVVTQVSVQLPPNCDEARMLERYITTTPNPERIKMFYRNKKVFFEIPN